MKIETSEHYGFVLSELYNGVSIQTDAGLFSVAMRDDGIEIRLGDGPWYRWDKEEGPEKLKQRQGQLT